MDSVKEYNTKDSSGGDECGNGIALKKGPWTSAEDAVLVAYVSKHGEGNWNNVQKHSGLQRCGKSCRLRWANHLRPNLKKGAFTPEEERLIIELHAKLGNKWARMAAQLPGRTDNEIKNYWNTRIKRRLRAGLPVYPSDVHSLMTTPVESSFVYNENAQGADISDCETSPTSTTKLRTRHVNLAALHGMNSNMDDFSEMDVYRSHSSPIILRRASSKRLRESGNYGLELYRYAGDHPYKTYGCEYMSSPVYGEMNGSMFLGTLLNEARMMDNQGVHGSVVTDSDQQLVYSNPVDNVVTMMEQHKKKLEQDEQVWSDQVEMCVFSEESMNNHCQQWEESTGTVEQPCIASKESVYTDEEISTLLDFARTDSTPLNLDWEYTQNNVNIDANNNTSGFIPYICSDGYEGPDMYDMDIFGVQNTGCYIWDGSPWSTMPGATQLPCDECKPLISSSSISDTCPIY